MFRQAAGLSLALFLPSTVVCRPQIYDEPYVALLERNASDYSRKELKSLRSEIQGQRGKQIDACKNEEARLKQQLELARGQLKDINKSGLQDTGATAETREGLHKIISKQRKSRSQNTDGMRAWRVGGILKANWMCASPKTGQGAAQKSFARSIEAWREHASSVTLRISVTGNFSMGRNRHATGEQAVRQMTFSGMMPAPLQDAVLQEYVQRLAAKVARNSDLKVPLHVSVVDSAEISAIALPGGYLFLSSGLLQAAGTEAELAGIVSHEIARIAARHGTRATKRSRISSIFVQAAHVATGLFTGGFGSAPAQESTRISRARRDCRLTDGPRKYEGRPISLAFSTHGKQASTKGIVVLLDSISQKEYSKTAGFFRTHPQVDERLLDIFSEIQFLPESAAGTRDSLEFHQIKERIGK